VVEFDEVISAGGTSHTTIGVIPEATSVMAITGRIISGFDGGVTSWALGVSGSVDRYGSGLGVSTDAWIRGLTGQPQSYYSDTPLTLEATGGGFGTGIVRFSIHLFSYGLPRAA
jgi:hypothetical protein